jgi:hypothetical protein
MKCDLSVVTRFYHPLFVSVLPGLVVRGQRPRPKAEATGGLGNAGALRQGHSNPRALKGPSTVVRDFGIDIWLLALLGEPMVFGDRIARAHSF